MATRRSDGELVTELAALEVSDVTVRFGDAVAVSNVSFTLAPGSTLAVLGPSGSGKSSLLRAIAGLEPTAAGTISIDGVNQSPVPINERQLGMMFQDHALFPHLDVAANVSFGLKMRGVTGAEAARRVAEVLALVGLEGFDGRHVQTLSGGEAQRVALARSLAPSPRVLLLDEPLGSLDRILREDLVGELRSLFARLEVTVVHVTHDQQEAFALADDVLIMRDGEVVQHGPPTELWYRPADAFVAEFLGHPNIWSGPNGTVVAPISSLELTDSASSLDAQRHTVAQCLVSDVEFREGRWRLSLDEQSGSRRCITVDSDRPQQVGDVVLVRIDHGALHTLGEGSGDRET